MTIVDSTLKQAATIIFPKEIATKEGLLFGFNVSEFLVVVLDILPVKNKADYDRIKFLVDHKTLKSTIHQSFGRRLKILGSIQNKAIKKTGFAAKLRSLGNEQYDIWVNLERNAKNAIVFKGLVLCGYLYNTICNLIFYDHEDNRIKFPGENRLKDEFKDSELQTQHKFYLSDFDYLKQISSGKYRETIDTDKDDFDISIYLLNHRELFLFLWRKCLEEFSKNQDLSLKRIESKRIDTNSVQKILCDIENTQERGYEELFLNRRSKKENQKQTETLINNSQEEDDEQEQTPLYLTSLDLKDPKLDQFRLFKKDDSLKIEPNSTLKFILKVNEYQSMMMLVVYWVFSNVLSPLRQLNFTSYSVRQLSFKIKSAKKMITRLKQLKKEDSIDLSTFFKRLNKIYSTIFYPLIDIILGLLVWWLLSTHISSVIGFFSQVTHITGTKVLRVQLKVLSGNPLGMKQDSNVAYIFYELLNFILVISEYFSKALSQYATATLRILLTTNILGFSFFLSECLDLAQFFSLKIKFAYICLHWVFSQQLTLIKKFYHMMRGVKKNVKEDYLYDAYYPPYLRVLSILLLVLLCSILNSSLIFWTWAFVNLIFVYSLKLTIEFLLTFINFFPLGGLIISHLTKELSPGTVDIRHEKVGSNINYYKLEYKDGGSGWKLDFFSQKLLKLVNLKSIVNIFRFKETTLQNLIFGFSPKNLFKIKGLNSELSNLKTEMKKANDIIYRVFAQ